MVKESEGDMRVTHAAPVTAEAPVPPPGTAPPGSVDPIARVVARARSPQTEPAPQVQGPAPVRRRINLALQGGGAHGAFTWGVLDRLLEDPEIEICGVSGTSAGALNGAALKAGLARGGPDEARAQLDWVWTQMGAISDLRLTHWLTALWPFAPLMVRVADTALSLAPRDYMSQIFSPYSYGAAYVNPLDRVVRRIFMDDICAKAGPALFISATNVRTGRIRVFSGEEITGDVILASACLPSIFQAVEIPDPKTGRTEAYWDGGYTGNPALFPLYDPALPDDIVIVNINPLRREEVPRTPLDIENRVNEVSFNASLMAELRSIVFVKELIAQGRIPHGAMKDVRVHMIADDALMNELSASTKLMPSPFFLNGLREAGRAAAETFLGKHKADLNECSSLPIEPLL